MSETHHVYVLLTDTGTWFTRMIRLFTRAQLNHASIALDRELTEVYSFGRKHRNNPWSGGFVREDMKNGLFKQASCEIYSYAVSKETYEQIRKQIREFERNKHLYKYNLIGLIGVLLNKPIKRKYAYFCTQFVAAVFQRSGAALSDKPPELMKPADIVNATGLRKLYCGTVPQYMGALQTAQSAAAQLVTA